MCGRILAPIGLVMALCVAGCPDDDDGPGPADVTDDLTAFLNDSDPEAPWADACIFQTRIRRNIKLAEAPSFGQSIFDYAPTCPGAQDYRALADDCEQLGTIGHREPPWIAECKICFKCPYTGSRATRTSPPEPGSVGRRARGRSIGRAGWT